MSGRIAIATIAMCLIASPAATHPAPFSYLDLFIASEGVRGTLVVHDYDVAHDVGVDPPERLRDQAVAEQYRDVLTRLLASRLAITGNGEARAAITWTGFETLPERQSIRLAFTLDLARPARLAIAATLFPYDPVHQTFINVYEDGTLRHQAILDTNRTRADYYAGTWQGTGAVLAVFIPAGIEHILIGPDHVLFVIGLLLAGGGLWRLATIVTAFTVGHSLTLSLAALDVLNPPAHLVEPAIALSIVFVGADNLLVQRDLARTSATGDRGATPRPRDIRPWIAGIFGLIHGFGFAYVLKELGLPLTALGWSLFSFNIGVELGQLAIVLVVAAALAWLGSRSPAVTRRVTMIGSMAVLVAGAYWFVQRVFFPAGV